MTPLFLCAGCGHAVPMDQTGPTFGLCAHCEASLSNRSSAWTANHRTQQGVANQFHGLQQRQPAPPIVPEKQSGTAGTGKKNPEAVRKFSGEERKSYTAPGWQSIYQIKGEMIS
jgi:hypothetical protein